MKKIIIGLCLILLPQIVMARCDVAKYVDMKNKDHNEYLYVSVNAKNEIDKKIKATNPGSISIKVSEGVYDCYSGTLGCRQGLSGAHLEDRTYTDFTVFACYFGLGGYKWVPLISTKCTEEELKEIKKTNRGFDFIHDGKYYYTTSKEQSLNLKGECYVTCKTNEVWNTSKRECIKKNVSVEQPAQTKVSEQTKTQQQSTTKVSNTKNSSQKIQKNNESSNKPAALQQQAPVEEYECDKEKLQQLAEWSTKYAANENISAAIKELEEYCNKQKDKNERTFTIKYNTLADMINELEEENALQKQKEEEAAQQAENEKAKQQSRTKITSTIKILDDISGRFELSVWKDEDGNFNTARLVSDSVAGVVLGTAGGLITSNVVKKNQVESGFEDIKCTIGGQVVADWGDQFRVGIR